MLQEKMEALGEDGNIQAWGYNREGQCGIASNELVVKTATKIDNIKNIVKISDLCFMIDINDKIYKLEDGLYKDTGDVYKRRINDAFILEDNKIKKYISTGWLIEPSELLCDNKSILVR